MVIDIYNIYNLHFAVFVFLGQQISWTTKTPGFASFGKRNESTSNQLRKVFFAAMVILNEDRDLSWTGVKQIFGQQKLMVQTDLMIPSLKLT